MGKIIGNLVGTTLPRIQVDKVLDANSSNAVSNKVVTYYLKDFEAGMTEIGMLATENQEQIGEIHDNAFVYSEDAFDSDVIDLELSNNIVTYFGVVSSINVTKGYEATQLGFCTALYFETPSEIPANYSQFPADVYFKGDSTDNGAFVPEANMRYTIVFDFDGYMLNGYVSGVTRV